MSLSSMRMSKISIEQAVKSNLAYYNEVASRYNSIMKDDAKNTLIRQFVQKTFISLVPTGTVIDFGGGTGLDLEWLSKAGYTIYFCEPSEAMREQAKDLNEKLINNKDIIFLTTDEADFEKWNEEFPFEQNIDAILSNFGVVNYIPDLQLLFNQVAMNLSPGGHFIFTMLEFDFKKRFAWHRGNAIRSLFFRTSFKMYIPFKNELQHVFVYTPQLIKKMSKFYFNYNETRCPGSGDFILIDLVRNEKAYQKMANG